MDDKYAGRAPHLDALAEAAESAASAMSEAAANMREVRWRAHGGPAAAEAELGYSVASFVEYLKAREGAGKDVPPTDSR